MKGYVFTYGVDGFGADVAPAFEEGCYLNFDKAFAHLIELNHDKIIECDSDCCFFEEGYGIDYYPSDDIELSKAEEAEDWDLFDKLMNKHIITDEVKINKCFIDREPRFGFYALEEIEIKED